MTHYGKGLDVVQYGRLVLGNERKGWKDGLTSRCFSRETFSRKLSYIFLFWNALFRTIFLKVCLSMAQREPLVWAWGWRARARHAWGYFRAMKIYRVSFQNMNSIILKEKSLSPSI